MPETDHINVWWCKGYLCCWIKN